jgi:hypothetical protein
MELVIDHLGSAYGQNDYEMRVMDGAASAGVLSFSEFDGRPYVNGIRVEESHRHRGIASMMLRNLQRRYAGVPIDFGYTTPDGTLLLAGLSFQEVANPVYAEALERRVQLAARIEDFEASAEKLKTAVGAEREAIIATIEEWNEVSDELDDAEEIIARQPQVFRLVDVGA